MTCCLTILLTSALFAPCQSLQGRIRTSNATVRQSALHADHGALGGMQDHGALGGMQDHGASVAVKHVLLRDGSEHGQYILILFMPKPTPNTLVCVDIL